MSLPRCTGSARLLAVGAAAVLVLAGCVDSPIADPAAVPPPGTGPAGTGPPTSRNPPGPGARLQGGRPLMPGVVPEPGGVGFRGDPRSLTVIDGSGRVPSGTRWDDGALRVDAANVVLDHVYVRGGVDFYGGGTLTIRNSIVEGDQRTWSPVMGRTAGSRLDLSDSTIRYRAGAPPPGPIWNNGAIQGDSTMSVVRCDISGTPTGIQNGPGDSLIEQNDIHGLKLLGVYPNETHNDGVQSYGGPGLVVRDNRIDIRGEDGRAYDGSHQTSAVFVQPSLTQPSTGLDVEGNYLVGGGFALRIEAPTTGAVVVDNTFGPTTGGFGAAAVDDGVVLTGWRNNVRESGASVPAR